MPERTDLKLSDAFDRAIAQCIEEGILTDYLQKLRGEAMGMLLTEFDEQEWEETIREESEDRLSLLMLKLRDAGREEDAWRVATDPDYRRKAFQEFKLV